MSVNNENSRRKFIRNSALAIGSAAIMPDALFAADGSKNARVINGANIFATGFDQTPLGYQYNALEPAIDAMTMEIHYSKHASTYSKNLKEAAQAEKIDTTKPLEDVLKNVSKY